MHAKVLYLESLEAYIHGLPYATILCTEAAMNSLQCQKLGKAPSLTKKGEKKPPDKRLPSDYKMPSTFSLINEAKSFINNDLKKELMDFIKIRHKIEHPKTQLDPLYMSWKYEGETLYSFDREEKDVSELFSLDMLVYAKMALTLYFRLSKSIFDWLKRN